MRLRMVQRKRRADTLQAILAQEQAMFVLLCLCVCVPIAVPVIFLCCLVSFVEISPNQWGRSPFAGMGFKCGRGVCTWRVECGKEELLAKAVTIDGHKEWYCRLLRDENTMFRAVPSVSSPSERTMCTIALSTRADDHHNNGCVDESPQVRPLQTVHAATQTAAGVVHLSMPDGEDNSPRTIPQERVAVPVFQFFGRTCRDVATRTHPRTYERPDRRRVS